MEDEGISVAPPRRSTVSTPSAADAVPAHSSVADAVPAYSSVADAVPAHSLVADAVPARSSVVDAVPAHSSVIISAVSAPSSPSSVAVSSEEAIPTSVLDPTPTFVPAPTDAPDLEDIHPQGSSRATGGILRGRAGATFYSPADEVKMFDGIGIAKMTAKIYTSDSNPLYLNHNNMVPSSKVTIKMNPNLGPILDNISQRYPAIKGIC